MNETSAEEKLHKNTRRVVGIAALRKIRIMIDDFEAQERKNKKRSIALLVILLLILLWFVGGVIHREPNYQNINTHYYNLEMLDIEYELELTRAALVDAKG